MRRRKMLIALGAAALMGPLVVRAQASGRLPRVGLLSSAPSSAEFPERHMLEGLRELGWIAGKNIVIESRYAAGDAALLEKYAAELVSLKVDVIVTFSAGVGAAKRATQTIPIVFGTSQNPVGSGMVTSLARPGASLTGVTYLTDELSAKRLALMKECLPRISRAAILWEPAHIDNEFKGMQTAAPALGVRLQSLEVPRPARTDEAERAVRSAIAARAEALIIAPGGYTIARRKQIIAAAVRSGLPVISAWSIFADDGALLTYGPDLSAISRRNAIYVDRVLKGARPADLPVEQPATFELVVNLKAAKALGIRVPQSILVRADRVIE